MEKTRAMEESGVKKRADAKADAYTYRKPITVPVAIIGVLIGIGVIGVRVIGIRRRIGVVGIRRGSRVGGRIWIGRRLCLCRQLGQLRLI
jgi:hypothetical protein